LPSGPISFWAEICPARRNKNMRTPILFIRFLCPKNNSFSITFTGHLLFQPAPFEEGVN
jgi:hypothetical protein